MILLDVYSLFFCSEKNIDDDDDDYDEKKGDGQQQVINIPWPSFLFQPNRKILDKIKVFGRSSNLKKSQSISQKKVS